MVCCKNCTHYEKLLHQDETFHFCMVYVERLTDEQVKDGKCDLYEQMDCNYPEI